jgi:hypothetical protein
VAAVFACGLAVFAIGAGQLLGLARCEIFTRQVEAIDRGATSANATVAAWSFAFGDRACTISVPVLDSELQRVRSIDTGPIFISEGKLREDYILRLVEAQSRSAFIDRMSTELRAVRSARGLDDDRYLELLVRAVQSIPFGSDDGRMRLPAEVVASGFGLCSEKSFLLAALMVHEGYDTAFWVLESQNHVAPGVAVDSPLDFRGSGYAFIETTRIAYIGEISKENRAAGPLARPPQLVRLGGAKRYQTGEQVAYVLGELERAERATRDPQPYPRLLTSLPLASGDVYRAIQRERELAIRRVTYLRGQSDEPEAAYAYLMRAAYSAESIRAEDAPGVLESGMP